MKYIGSVGSCFLMVFKGKIMAEFITNAELASVATELQADLEEISQKKNEQNALLENQKRLDGVIKWFDQAKGYGFILHQSGQDVFVHKSQVTEEIDEGATVSYILVETEKGLRAINVKKY